MSNLSKNLWTPTPWVPAGGRGGGQVPMFFSKLGGSSNRLYSLCTIEVVMFRRGTVTVNNDTFVSVYGTGEFVWKCIKTLWFQQWTLK